MEPVTPKQKTQPLHHSEAPNICPPQRPVPITKSEMDTIIKLLERIAYEQEQVHSDMLEQMQIDLMEREKTYKPVRTLSRFLNLIIFIQLLAFIIFIVVSIR